MHIQVDGTEYPLRYSLRALKQFENKAKTSVFKMGKAEELSAEAMAWLIYVGIVDGCKFEGIEFKQTLADIEPHVDLSHVQTAVAALHEYTGGNEKKATTRQR